MLTELRVENLGVIAEMSLVFGPGMTVVTGETGTGKTLVVEAIELLLGARADTSLVRAGAPEARVEARFTLGSDALEAVQARAGLSLEDGELVIGRVVAAEGKSRAYVNGRLAPARTLSDLGRLLVDLHGQHTHHALLTPAAQRAALDQFGGAKATEALAAYRGALARIRESEEALAALGGDDRSRAREVELLQFQIGEIDAAAIQDLEEEDALATEEALLSSAGSVRESATMAAANLDGQASDALSAAARQLEGQPGIDDAMARIRLLQDELAEVSRTLRDVAESTEDDPARLEAVVARRHHLRDLRRKYGDTLSDVLAFRTEAAARLEDLLQSDARAARAAQLRGEAEADALACATLLRQCRSEAGPKLQTAIEAQLRELGTPATSFLVDLQPADRADNGSMPRHGLDEVEFRLGANPGEPPLPLARVASGGELARTMLAARVVLTDGAPTFVFDEVDAGIGGQAGVAVGRKLGLVARHHQVLCVTHLAQVAAFADAHLVVEKRVVESSGELDGGERTVADARFVDGPDRVAELSRMLSGSGTDRARQHAEELLASAAHPA